MFNKSDVFIISKVAKGKTLPCLFIVLTSLFVSCSLNEKKAIELVKTTKIQLNISEDNPFANLLLGAAGLSQGATWQDFANNIAKKEPNSKYSWSAHGTKEKGVYLVAFTDTCQWGYRWEVVLKEQTVNILSGNEYLCRKYGLSRLDRDGLFQIVNVIADSLKLVNSSSYYSDEVNKYVVCILKAHVINKTGKILTSADISGTLKVIFKDKTIEGSSTYNSGFKLSPSKNDPWKPETERLFLLKTKGIEQIYLNYSPEYVFFEIGLKAEDPIGYTYDKNIAEYDLKERWSKLKD